jgi:CO dehydrogenase maturation factor
MGAGIEHLTRGTSSGVDLMLIVTEPGKSSVQTARVVEKLASEIGIKNIKFIANKVRTDREDAFIRENFKQEELLDIVHFDEVISEKAMGVRADLSAGQVDNEELEKMLSKIVSSVQ